MAIRNHGIVSRLRSTRRKRQSSGSPKFINGFRQLGLQDCLTHDQFHFDSVGILKENAVVSSGERVLIRVENGNSPGFQLFSDFVNLSGGLGVKGQMIQSNPASMIPNAFEALFNLNKYNVGVVESPTLPLIPRLVELITKAFQKPTPKIGGFRQVTDIDLYMVKSIQLSILPSSAGSRTNPPRRTFGALTRRNLVYNFHPHRSLKVTADHPCVSVTLDRLTFGQHNLKRHDC